MADSITLQNPTFGTVKLKNNTTDDLATKVNVQSTDGTINTISKSDLVNVVEVNDAPSLPLIGEAGKIYVVKNLNKIYRWNGTFYQELAYTDVSIYSKNKTIAQIRALSGEINNNFYTTDIGQEGNWYYDASDITSIDNLGTVLVTSDGKRIKRIFDNGVSINWFGAKTTNTASQNTTAFDLAIAWAISNNGGKIRIPAGKYSVNPIHIPAVSVATGRIIPIEITGEYMPNQLFGTIGSIPLNYSGSVFECLSTVSGESVIIADAHPYDFGGFSGVKPIIKNLDIRTYNNSQIGGVNVKYAHQAVVENCQITNGVWSVDSSLPTYPNAVGVHTPNLDNAALTILKNVSISGFFTGIIVNEHTDGSSLNLTCNLIAMDFKTANHSSSFAMVDMQRNTVGIKFSGNHAVNIDNLNLEHAGYTQTNPNNIWQLTTYDIDDSLNKGKGLINWYSVLGAFGNTPNDLRLNGGNNIKYINLHENKIEVNSGAFNGEYKYNSDVSTPNSRAWKTKNDSSIAGSWALQVALDLPETSFKDVITSDKEGRVNFNNVTSVSNTESSTLAVTAFYLKNNDGTSFGDGGSFFQTNNFGYLQIQPNQTNIYAYKSGGLRFATGNSRIVFANGNSDLDESTIKFAIETDGSVKISNLSGTGNRNVVAAADGTLIIDPNTTNRMLAQSYVDSSTTSTTPVTLFSYTMPAGTLEKDGDLLDITVGTTGGGSSGEVSIYIGGNMIGIGSINVYSIGKITVIRTSATTVKYYYSFDNTAYFIGTYTINNMTSASNVIEFKLKANPTFTVSLSLATIEKKAGV